MLVREAIQTFVWKIITFAVNVVAEGQKLGRGSYKDLKSGGRSETVTSSGLRQDEFFARKRE